MTNRPLIAITATQQDGKINISQDYLNAVWTHGGLGAIIPQLSDIHTISDLCNEFHGLILSGGGDIDPKIYCQQNTASKNICSFRDEFEFELIKQMLLRKKPILGICRGAQVLNVYFGGTLNQHIEGHLLDGVGHDLHKIELSHSSIYHNFVDKSTFKVNSFHHQCVDKLAPCLTCDGFSGNCIEGFHHNDFSFCVGVQWHPEKLTQSPVSKYLFTQLIKEALKVR